MLTKCSLVFAFPVRVHRRDTVVSPTSGQQQEPLRALDGVGCRESSLSQGQPRSVCFLLHAPLPTWISPAGWTHSPTNETTALWEALAQFARPHQTMLQPVGVLGTLAPPAPWTVTLQLKSHGWDLSRQLVLPRPHLTSSQVSCPFHHRQDKDTSSDMYNSPRPQLANLCARCCPSQLLLSLRQYKQRSL